MRDIIFVSMENWDDVWRRNQFVVTGLVRRHPGIKVLFVGLARDVSNDLRHQRLNAFRQRSTWTVPGFPNVTVTHPIKLLPNSSGFCRQLNEKLMRDHVRRLAHELRIKEPILWLNPHYAVHMVGQMSETAVVYDVTDDWTKLTQSTRVAKLVEAQDTTLCRRADAVIVCSRHLYDLKRVYSRDVHLIPNGVDPQHYRVVLEGTGPLPEPSKGWKKPVLGYTGTLHPDRLDLQLLEQVAERWNGSVVLVGPDLLSTQDRGRLQRRRNVVRVGPLPYHELPQHMRGFDVSIVPHRVTPFTESLNPIKLWEYLAAGKPIVSTDVAGFRDYPQHVRLARTAEQFLRHCEEALVEPASDARRREALRHSWDSRLDDIEAVLTNLAPPPVEEVAHVA